MKTSAAIAALSLIAIACLAAPEAAPAQQAANPAVASLERQVAAQQARITDISSQMIDLDSEMERTIDRVINYLRGLKDSMDSGVRVTDLKVDAIKKLRNSIEFYQRLRSMRVTALNSSYSAVPKDALAGDVTKLDQRINERANQIVELTTSLAQHQDFKKYVYYRDYDHGGVRKRMTDEYKQDRDVVSRSEDTREGVISGLRRNIQSLEDDNSRTRRQLEAAPVSQRAALEARIDANNKAIEERRAQIEDILTAQQPPQKPVSLKAAGDVERLVDDITRQLQDQQDNLMQLNTQRDAERAKLATLEMRLKNAKAATAAGK